MLRRISIVVLFSMIALAVGSVRDAEAGGIILYELGTPDVGRASAGWAARANDAATLFTNPAGMSRLSGQRLLVGGQLMYGQFGFNPDENTMVDGNDGGNPVGWLPGGSIFYTHELPSGWNVGLGAFSYFGLGAKYDQGWVGRYYVQESGIIGFSLMPAVSYRVNEQLSFGAGLNWMFGMFSQEAAVRNVAHQTDGAYELSDNTQGFGADVGYCGNRKMVNVLGSRISRRSSWTLRIRRNLPGWVR
jgi:long-chain fatty acid transport protein